MEVERSEQSMDGIEMTKEYRTLQPTMRVLALVILLIGGALAGCVTTETRPGRSYVSNGGVDYEVKWELEASEPTGMALLHVVSESNLALICDLAYRSVPRSDTIFLAMALAVGGEMVPFSLQHGYKEDPYVKTPAGGVAPLPEEHPRKGDYTNGCRDTLPFREIYLLLAWSNQSKPPTFVSHWTKGTQITPLVTSGRIAVIGLAEMSHTAGANLAFAEAAEADYTAGDSGEGVFIYFSGIAREGEVTVTDSDNKQSVQHARQGFYQLVAADGPASVKVKSRGTETATFIMITAAFPREAFRHDGVWEFFPKLEPSHTSDRFP